MSQERDKKSTELEEKKSVVLPDFLKSRKLKLEPDRQSLSILMGNLLLTPVMADKIVIFNTETGAQSEEKCQNAGKLIRLTDTTFINYGRSGGIFQLWEVKDDKVHALAEPLAISKEAADDLFQFQFVTSPDGRFLAAVFNAGPDDPSVKLWVYDFFASSQSIHTLCQLAKPRNCRLEELSVVFTGQEQIALVVTGTASDPMSYFQLFNWNEKNKFDPGYKRAIPGLRALYPSSDGKYWLVKTVNYSRISENWTASFDLLDSRNPSASLKKIVGYIVARDENDLKYQGVWIGNRILIYHPDRAGNFVFDHGFDCTTQKEFSTWKLFHSEKGNLPCKGFAMINENNFFKIDLQGFCQYFAISETQVARLIKQRAESPVMSALLADPSLIRLAKPLLAIIHDYARQQMDSAFRPESPLITKLDLTVLPKFADALIAKLKEIDMTIRQQFPADEDKRSSEQLNQIKWDLSALNEFRSIFPKGKINSFFLARFYKKEDVKSTIEQIIDKYKQFISSEILVFFESANQALTSSDKALFGEVKKPAKPFD